MNELIEILRGMADMLDGPQNAGNLVIPAIIDRFREAADTIERLEIENAALHEEVGALEDISAKQALFTVMCGSTVVIKGSYELERENASLREQLANAERRLRQRDAMNTEQAKCIDRLIAERDAALNDLAGFCWACAHGEPAKIRTRALTTCNYMRELGTLARGGRCKCKHWQWRGPQKEDNGNDD